MDRDRHLLTGKIAVLTMIARDAPTNDALEAVVRLAETLEPTAVAGVTVVDRAERSLEMAVFPSVHHAFADAIAGVPLGPPHVGTCAQALYRGETVTSTDLKNDPRFAKEWRDLCADHGIGACRSQPVRSATGAPLGTFMLCFPEAREHTGFDEQMIAVCAELVELILERRRARERQDLLIGELHHRTSNLFASVGALAQVTLDGSRDLASFGAVFEGRLNALATAHSLMFEEDRTDLGLLLRRVLEPYGDEQRISIDGPLVTLSPSAASGFAMAAHELATNAAKYGPLSGGEGRLSVAWDISTGPDDASEFSLVWQESGGPPVSRPTRRGYGVRAIERMLAHEIEGRVHLDFMPSGLRCVIAAPCGQSLHRAH